MRLIRHLILDLVPLGIIAAVVASMFSTSTPIQGKMVEAINTATGPGSAYNTGNFDTLLASDKEAGQAYVREAVNWSDIETTQGTYNWSADRPLDAIFTSEKTAGMKIVAVLTGGPTYLNNSSAQPVNTTEFLVRWANFVQAAVNQYGEQVDIWEIGSHVNSLNGLSSFFIPSDPNASLIPDPATYAQMVKVASKIIKNADPNDQVWMGSLVSAASSNCAVNPLSFLLEINGTKAWNVIDSIQYDPDRGALAPEAALTSVTSACASSLPMNSTTLAGEVQALLDLARQLGGKTVRIEGIGWTSDEIAALSANRNITSDQALADLQTRASIQLLGNDGITQLFWQVNSDQQAASRALGNLNSVLKCAQFVGQMQGQTGSVFEYRFQKGSQWIIIAWRATDGDTPYPVNLTNLKVDHLKAYAVDAPSFNSEEGITIPVDASGNAVLMLNERPVVFIGKIDSISEAVQADAEYRASVVKYEARVMVHGVMNDIKAAIMQALESALTSAKDKAIQWGEDKLNELLN